MNLLKRHWLSILLTGVICLLLIEKCSHVPVIPQQDLRIDTIVKIKYIPQIIKVNNPPVKVIIYKDRDTTLRKKLEKEKIIEKVIFKKNEVDITTIDSTGRVETDTHKIEPDSLEVKISNTGQVEEKGKTRTGKAIKKIWKATKTGLAIIGVAVVVVFVAEHI